MAVIIVTAIAAPMAMTIRAKSIGFFPIKLSDIGATGCAVGPAIAGELVGVCDVDVLWGAIVG